LIPTYVIGLREGLEAALIVSIVAAFLKRQGQRQALRYVWLGVAIAVVLCTAVGIALQLLDEQLPQQGQEQLETVIGVCAVVIVSFMIFWMRRNAAGLRGDIERSAAAALATGSVAGLVAMAFFAVLREGLETAVFLLAAFQASGNALTAGLGALLGILTAVVIGAALYRGGIRINLARFFKVTAVFLVLIAAGLLASAVHTGHEGGWINSLQGQALDLSWLVVPGTVTSSLLTGMLGLQPRPTDGEVAAYLIYAVPMLLFVLWPQRPARARSKSKAKAKTQVTLAICAAVAAAALLSACGSTSPPKGSKLLAVTLTDSGCTPQHISVASGPVTFDVTNGGTSKVSEMELKDSSGVIVGESENVVEGLKGKFSLNLGPDKYVVNCPSGDAEDQGTLVATGTATAQPKGASAALLQAATAGYKRYVESEVALLRAGTARFAAALKRGDVAGAKDLFGPVRAHYEAIEPVAESFGDLDPEIDARVNDVEKLSEWSGFHRIEQTLWQKNTTKGTEVYGERLLRDVETLQQKVRALKLQPAQLANGAVELMNEVSNSKITGEEDRYSHTDLSDFEGNLAGSRKAFELLRAALRQTHNAKLVTEIEARFAVVQSGLDAYKRDTPLGFAPYGELTKGDRAKLAKQVGELDEPLATIATKVNGA
jgi:iron uptake system component EfeO